MDETLVLLAVMSPYITPNPDLVFCVNAEATVIVRAFRLIETIVTGLLSTVP